LKVDVGQYARAVYAENDDDHNYDRYENDPRMWRTITIIVMLVIIMIIISKDSMITIIIIMMVMMMTTMLMVMLVMTVES